MPARVDAADGALGRRAILTLGTTVVGRQHWMSSSAGGVTGPQGLGSHEVASTTMPP